MKESTVLISGASGGLGGELVRIFAGKGFHVIATDKVLPEGTRPDGNITCFQLDVTRPEEIKNLAASNFHDNGLDILICAAGIYDIYPLCEADPNRFRDMMAVNLHGTVSLVQGLLGPLIKNQGRVLVISSESYKIQAMFQPYMISKASLEAYCAVARQELSLKGVRLSVIRPGAIRTPLLKWMDSNEFASDYTVFKSELVKSWMKSLKMVGKLTPPEVVARKIFHAAIARKPKRVYLVNNNLLLTLVSLLPKRFLDYLMVRMFREK